MGPEITSTHARRITAARRLTKRAFRAADGRFLAEGPQAVREAVLARASDGEPVAVEVFTTAEAAARYADVLDAADGAGVPVARVSGEVLESLSQTVTPQGLVAVCRALEGSLDDVLAGRPRLVAVLSNVRDPGNAGTVVRAADAAGADAVLLADASVDPYNGKCVRASAGSLFHLPVVVAGSTADLAPRLRAAGLTVLAADASGDDLDDLTDAGELADRTAWVFGNEAWGLPEPTRALADRVVRVPIHGRAESLNLATAATVCLYASARAQRRSAG